MSPVASLNLRLLLAAALGLAAAGCGAASLSPDSYDRSCAADTDCAPVLVGDLCSCRCDYAAIRASELPRYSEDRARISCNATMLCGPCQDAKAVCAAGRCAVK